MSHSRTLQINRAQLRAVLILLAILPLLPTSLLIRYMFESVMQERQTMNNELENMTLRQARVLEARFAAEAPAELQGPAPEALALARWVRSELGEDNQVQVLDAANTELAYAGEGSRKPRDRPWLDLKVGPPSWHVQWARPLPGLLSPEFRQQTWQMVLVGAATFLLVSVVAFIAGREITRRLELTEIRTDWLSQLAHELRTPVASLRALTDTLVETSVGDDPVARAEYYQMLSRESRRLWLVSEMFLWHSRLERQEDLNLRREPVSLAALLRDCAEEFAAPVEALGGLLSLDLPATDLQALADPEALRVMLRNLLENAVKYRGTQPLEIALGLREAEAGCAEIRVQDKGIGIPAAEQERVFESFMQVDDRLSSRAQGGCGLGLSIVRRLAAALGGQVTLQSAPGQGSTFTLHLPCLAS